MYRSFRVGPEKGLTLAELDHVPPLTIVSGPNGAGKSTLLELLHRHTADAEPGTRVMYINPNRPWRRSSINALATLGMANSFQGLLADLNTPQFPYGVPPGLSVFNYSQGTARSRDTVDDVQSLVKLAILRLETRRRTAITERVDAGQRGDELDFDSYEPMRRYISSLLPHLKFVRVDTSIESDQKVLFEKLDGDQPLTLELDDLSSGEKAVVGLMFPYIEAEAERIMTGSNTAGPVPTVLIDEPELHLHPALQTNLVTYMRELAQAQQAQFILCRHSPSIIDSADEGELFVLAPPATTGGNQLLPVAHSAARLEAIRELTGSAFTVTRCRPIVFIEGEPVGARKPSDQRVLELLVPESKSWVLVPAHGRNEAIRAATDLRQPALTGLPGLAVFALVDNDQGYEPEPEFVITWSVAMQENLLLDVEAIWSMIEPHVHVSSSLPSTKDDLSRQLITWCRERTEREIELRVRRKIARLVIHEAVTSSDEVSQLAEKVTERVTQYLQELGGPDVVAQARAQAAAEVNALLEREDDALAKFHGKELLDRLFDRYAQAAGWSGKAAFIYNLAAQVSRTNSPRLSKLLTVPVQRITGFIPEALVTTLEAVAQLDEFRDSQELAGRVRASDKRGRQVVETPLTGWHSELMSFPWHDA